MAHGSSDHADVRSQVSPLSLDFSLPPPDVSQPEVVVVADLLVLEELTISMDSSNLMPAIARYATVTLRDRLSQVSYARLESGTPTCRLAADKPPAIDRQRAQLNDDDDCCWYIIGNSIYVCSKQCRTTFFYKI